MPSTVRWGNMNDSMGRKPFLTQHGNHRIYHLYVTDTVVNYTGRKANAVAINGSIPGPNWSFEKGIRGDMFIISCTWKPLSTGMGLYSTITRTVFPLTTAAIAGHSTLVYKFPIVQNGTHWYHSHSMLQERAACTALSSFTRRMKHRIMNIPCY